MNQRIVIFDWDGTLVDSVDRIADSLHRAATDLGCPALEREAYRDIIGLGLPEALEVLYPELSAEERLEVRDGYARYFFAQTAAPQNVFAGMQELLTDLRASGRSCAVATGKSRRGLDAALVNSELGMHFEVTRCADETRSKPDPAMLVEILEHYQLSPENAVMIGDTRYDLDMAQRLGMPSIGVEWGVHCRKVLGQYAPRALVNSVTDLRQALAL